MPTLTTTMAMTRTTPTSRRHPPERNRRLCPHTPNPNLNLPNPIPALASVCVGMQIEQVLVGPPHDGGAGEGLVIRTTRGDIPAIRHRPDDAGADATAATSAAIAETADA